MNSQNEKRGILFDLDGTLIDQFEAIHSAFSKTLVSMGFSAPSYNEVRRAVGGASEATMTKLIGPSRAKEGVNKLRPIFEKEMFCGLKLLPGVMEGIQKIKASSFKCAVLTNKYGPHARSACKHLKIDQYLEFTIGANDTKWKKPDQELTFHALEKLNTLPAQTIYVGDSPYDFQTAKNSQLDCYLVATGTHSFEELSKLNGDKTYRNFKEFVQFLLA